MYPFSCQQRAACQCLHATSWHSRVCAVGVCFSDCTPPAHSLLPPVRSTILPPHPLQVGTPGSAGSAPRTARTPPTPRVWWAARRGPRVGCGSGTGPCPAQCWRARLPSAGWPGAPSRLLRGPGVCPGGGPGGCVTSCHLEPAAALRSSAVFRCKLDYSCTSLTTSNQHMSSRPVFLDAQIVSYRFAGINILRYLFSVNL